MDSLPAARIAAEQRPVAACRLLGWQHSVLFRLRLVGNHGPSQFLSRNPDRMREGGSRDTFDAPNDIDFLSVFAAPLFGDVFRAEAHFLDQEDNVRRMLEGFASDRRPGVADLADADTGRAHLVVVRLQRGEIVRGAVLRWIEHVQAVNDDERDLFLPFEVQRDQS